MDTADFLTLILPTEGLQVIVAIRGTSKQSFTNSCQLAAQSIKRLDTGNSAVYHACASYKDTSSRKAVNVHAVKCFWLDVDCGPTKPFPDQAAGIVAVELFSKQLGLFDPYIVKSGNGLHVYWVLEQSITPGEWLATASLLKAICVHKNFQAGPERTADIASILRPVGTMHRKDPMNPIPVEMVVHGDVGPYDYFHAQLTAYAADQNLDTETPDSDLGARPAHITLPLSDDLEQTMVYGPPPLVDNILANCNQIRLFKETGGTREPLWRGAMSVVKACQDGEKLCHEWSSVYPKYSRQETQRKLDKISGPYSCKMFQTLNRAGCAGCPFTGTSPIALGHAAAQAPAPLALLSPPACAAATPAPQPYQIPPMPHGFHWTPNPAGGSGGGLFADVKDKAGNMTQQRFCETLFYAYDKREDRQAGVVLMMRSHPRANRVREFDVPTELIASPNDLLKLLAKNEISATNRQGALMVEFAHGWMAQLRAMTDALQTAEQFGWTEDKGFIHGDVVLKPGGVEQRVILAPNVRKIGSRFEPKGSLETWKALVDRAYNHDGLESLQFAVLAGLAAPLVKMFNDIGGIMVYLHTDKSGKGKTTASRVALSAWCAWAKQQMTHNAATVNAMFGMFGIVSNMPVVIDEMTNMDNAVVGNMIHIISAGNPKLRSTQNGGMVERDAHWQTIVIGSGNMLLSEKVGQHRLHSEAERARIFEYTLDIRQSPLSTSEAMRLFPEFSEHYGHAGRAFIRYVVDNYDDVKEQLYANQEKLAAYMRISQMERYWSVLLASVFTAHEIALKLQLIQFPMSPMVRWVRQTLNENRGSIESAGVDMQQLFSRMLGELWKDFIVSQGEGKMYGGSEPFVDQHPRAAVHGRVITQRVGISGNLDPQAVYVSSAAIKTWCNKHGVTAREMFKAAVNASLVLPKEKVYNLGTGIRQYKDVGSVACWQVVPTVGIVVNAIPQIPPKPALAVVKGGKSSNYKP